MLLPRRALSNRWALAALFAVLALQALAVVVPALRTLLDTVPLGARDWGVVLVLAVIPALVGQTIRLLRLRGTRGVKSDNAPVTNRTDSDRGPFYVD